MINSPHNFLLTLPLSHHLTNQLTTLSIWHLPMRKMTIVQIDLQYKQMRIPNDNPASEEFLFDPIASTSISTITWKKLDNIHYRPHEFKMVLPLGSLSKRVKSKRMKATDRLICDKWDFIYLFFQLIQLIGNLMYFFNILERSKLIQISNSFKNFCYSNNLGIRSMAQHHTNIKSISIRFPVYSWLLNSLAFRNLPFNLSATVLIWILIFFFHDLT